MIHRLSDGLELYYEIQGNEHAAVTLVFLNGLSQNTVSWVGISPAFYSDYRVVLVDFIFQGQSSKAEKFRSYDEHAGDIVDLLKSISRNDSESGKMNSKIVLVGISYGSAIAQHLIVNYPDFFSGAILLSTFGHATEQFNAIGESWIAALHAGNYPLMLEVMLPVVIGKSYFEKPLIPVQTLKESRAARDLDTDSLLKLMEGTKERGDYREHLKQVKIPVLVVQGDEDFLIPPAVAKEVAVHIPEAEFVVIEKAGHTLNLEAIPQTIQLIKGFLLKLEKR